MTAPVQRPRLFSSVLIGLLALALGFQWAAHHPRELPIQPSIMNEGVLD